MFMVQRFMLAWRAWLGRSADRGLARREGCCSRARFIDRHIDDPDQRGPGSTSTSSLQATDRFQHPEHGDDQHAARRDITRSHRCFLHRNPWNLSGTLAVPSCGVLTTPFWVRGWAMYSLRPSSRSGSAGRSSGSPSITRSSMPLRARAITRTRQTCTSPAGKSPSARSSATLLAHRHQLQAVPEQWSMSSVVRATAICAAGSGSSPARSSATPAPNRHRRSATSRTDCPSSATRTRASSPATGQRWSGLHGLVVANHHALRSDDHAMR